MKVTIIGKPEDFIKQSRPEDVLNFVKPDQKNLTDVDFLKEMQDIDLDLDGTETER